MEARLGPVIRGDGPMSARPIKRKAEAARRSSAASKTLGKDPAPVANSAKVSAGQAKYRDRAGPQRRARDVTFAEWKGMSRAKRKMLGLPVSFLGGEIGFNRLLKGLSGKDSTMRTNK